MPIYTQNPTHAMLPRHLRFLLVSSSTHASTRRRRRRRTQTPELEPSPSKSSSRARNHAYGTVW
ncbi:hypothetical protein PVAP13_2NG385503 [Panicum virgatum]|uniref:Uncharacterized protein n=1 Tax=Panicum virgatum TaxID=38727 RepID=A0A8T0VGC4_PANVG|nr:hypothetical protein PVAP13_2NG385503 [Panicum virgatum]